MRLSLPRDIAVGVIALGIGRVGDPAHDVVGRMRGGGVGGWQAADRATSLTMPPRRVARGRS